MSLILYGAPLSPFVRKVDITLREKGVPFELEPVNIMPMPDWFQEISPARRIPVLHRSTTSPWPRRCFARARHATTTAPPHPAWRRR